MMHGTVLLLVVGLAFTHYFTIAERYFVTCCMLKISFRFNSAIAIAANIIYLSKYANQYEQ